MNGFAIFVPICSIFITTSQGNVAENILSSLSNDDITAIQTGYDSPFVFSGILFAGSQIVYLENLVQRLKSNVPLLSPSDSGEFEGSEYAIRTGWPYIHVAYFNNSDRSRESVSAGIKATPSGLTFSTPINATGTIDSCTYSAYTVLSVKDEATSSVEFVHFAVYVTDADPQFGRKIVYNGRVHGSKGRSAISVKGNPNNVVVGSVVLSKTGADPMQQTNLEAIVRIIAQRACDQLDTIVVEDCLNGEVTDTCQCDEGYGGARCETKCMNGDVVSTSPYNGQICDCELGFGGSDCSMESDSYHFMAKAQTGALKCQALFNDHTGYLYDEPGANPSSITPFMDQNLQNYIGAIEISGNIQSTVLQFGGDYSDSHNASLERTNDMLFAAKVEKEYDFDFKLEIETVYTTTVTSEQHTYQNGTLGYCDYHYHIVQEYRDGVNQAAAEVFFVTGVSGVSVMPAAVVRDPASVSSVNKRNSYSANGNDVEEIMIGFTLIGTDQQGQMSVAELESVAECYILDACNSIDLDCVNGVQKESDQGPICECTGDFVGIRCNLPLC
uniref:Histocompatibility ligand secreted form n=1 Tax=Botryllus schlosseri TaxID=30301 RepID=Q2XWP5_BOTSH